MATKILYCKQGDGSTGSYCEERGCAYLKGVPVDSEDVPEAIIKELGSGNSCNWRCSSPLGTSRTVRLRVRIPADREFRERVGQHLRDSYD